MVAEASLSGGGVAATSVSSVSSGVAAAGAVQARLVGGDQSGHGHGHGHGHMDYGYGHG